MNGPSTYTNGYFFQHLNDVYFNTSDVSIDT